MYALDAAILAQEITPMTQAITLAAVGGFFSVVVLVITNSAKKSVDERAQKQRNLDTIAAIEKERRDYTRQDEVAQRAEDRADELLRVNEKIVEVTQVNTQEVIEVKKLGTVTHALVNSDKTAALIRERLGLIATRASVAGQLAMGRELVRLLVVIGKRPTDETTTELGDLSTSLQALEDQLVTLDIEIERINSEIQDRIDSQRAAEAQIEAHTGNTPPEGVPVIQTKENHAS